MNTNEYTFTIHLSNGGDSEVDYSVTSDEMELIEAALENGDSFEDIDDLEDLYARVMKAAQEKLIEDLELGEDSEVDLEELDYTVDFLIYD